MKFLDKARKWLISFWPKGGFYLLTALCVVCVGTLAYAARQRALAPAPAPLPAPTPAAVSQSLDETLGEAQDQSPLGWPVSGREVLTPHSPQELIWSDTLNAYQTHTGVDISAVKGEVVTAAMDGRVTAAYADPLLGYTVELAHEDGVATRYANLSTLRLVSAGQQVKRGEQIGAVGDSASAESGMSAHLHFEAYQNGEWLPLPDVGDGTRLAD